MKFWIVFSLLLLHILTQSTHLSNQTTMPNSPSAGLLVSASPCRPRVGNVILNNTDCGIGSSSLNQEKFHHSWLLAGLQILL